ncbi:MAG: PEP-CTERM sorting domain-containing protein [Pirellulaceae bacterium]
MLAGITTLAVALAWLASPATAGAAVIANFSNVNTFAVFHESNSDPEDQDQQVQGGTLNPLSAHTSLTSSSLSYDLDASATWVNPSAGTVELDYFLGNSSPTTGPGFAGQAEFLYRFTVDAPTLIDLDYNIHAESTSLATHPVIIWWGGGQTTAAVLQNGFPIENEQYILHQLAGNGVHEFNHVGSTVLNIPTAGAYTLRLNVGGGATGPISGNCLTIVGPQDTAVPEPSSLVLLGTGALALLACGRRRTRQGSEDRGWGLSGGHSRDGPSVEGVLVDAPVALRTLPTSGKD